MIPKRGWKALLAKKAGVTRGYLNNLLHRRMCAHPFRARRLEKAALALGIDITRFDFMEADVTTNPLFVGDPKAE